MSKTANISLWIVVIALLVVGISWWMVGQSGITNAPVAGVSASPTPTPSVSPSATTTPAQTTLSATGSSNADLNADLSQIDGQMNAMNSDNASITQGMNDEPVEQESL